MVAIEIKLWFLGSLEHFWPDPKDTLSEVALFFEKIHKVFKNKAQGCSTPLITSLWLTPYDIIVARFLDWILMSLLYKNYIFSSSHDLSHKDININ